eukprot:9221290-Prorocentrum_lima.AAC.1
MLAPHVFHVLFIFIAHHFPSPLPPPPQVTSLTECLAVELRAKKSKLTTHVRGGGGVGGGGSQTHTA